MAAKTSKMPPPTQGAVSEGTEPFSQKPSVADPALRLIAWVVSLNPFLRYAVIPLAVGAGLFLTTKVFGISQSATLIASAVIAAFTIFFFLVARVVAAGQRETKLPVRILLWFFTVVFMVVILCMLGGIGFVLVRQYIFPPAEKVHQSLALPPPPSSATTPPPAISSVPENCECTNAACAAMLKAKLKPKKETKVAIDSKGYAHQYGQTLLIPQCEDCQGCSVTVEKVADTCCYRTVTGQTLPSCPGQFRWEPWSTKYAGSADQCRAGVCICSGT